MTIARATEAATSISNCRVCDSPELEPCIDLGEQPWANHFLTREQLGSEPRYPLRVVFCHHCRAAQLDHTVPKEIMFSRHTYLSGITASLQAHFAEVAAEVHARFLGRVPGARVLDIGSNDGSQLRHYQSLGHEVLGVEPAELPVRLARERGIPTEQAFFDLPLARRLAQREGSASFGGFEVINAAGVFFHLEDLHSAAAGIRLLLRPGGVFVVQCLYMKAILENGAFDQIYHEHLLYYTLRSLQSLLLRHDLHLVDARLSTIHGGSLIAFARAGTDAAGAEASARLRELYAAEERAGANEIGAYRRFAADIAARKQREVAFLEEQRRAGRRVFGLGAPVKGNTLLNHFQIDSDLLACLVERNPWRRGLYSPGMHIPVVIEDELADDDWPEALYVLAWNFRAEILERYKHLRARGVQLHFPIGQPSTRGVRA